MLFQDFKNKLDNFIKKANVIQTAFITQCFVVIALLWLVVYKIEEQKILVTPFSVIEKEFAIGKNEVSESFLEMTADNIIFNVFNIAPERKPNTNFLLKLAPPEYYSRVKSAIDNQIKFIQNNAISQVFYTDEYDTKKRGVLKVKGILKQYIADKRIESARYVVEIQYEVKNFRFGITGINLEKEGAKTISNEDESK